ncbi:unnamed protein product, partial [Rotaria sp. Silwood2]
NGDSINNHFQI